MQIDTNGFELDDIARDSTTGYEGRIVGFTQWTTGCARATLQKRIDPASKDGKVPEAISCDVTVLELVSKGTRSAAPVPASAAGGPQPTPARIPDARR